MTRFPRSLALNIETISTGTYFYLITSTTRHRNKQQVEYWGKLMKANERGNVYLL